MFEDQKTEDRKAQIVGGAFEALKKNGLADLSYDLVAEEAGLSRQLVRYHFPSNEDLMIAVCDYLAGLYRQALISSAGQLQGPQRVEMFLDFYFDLLETMPKPRDDQAYDAMMSLATRSEPIRTVLVDQYGLLGEVLSHEFGVQYPDIDMQSAKELSYLFVCLMYGHWKMVASLGCAEEHKFIARDAMDRLIQSYRQTASVNGKKVAVWKRKTS